MNGGRSICKRHGKAPETRECVCRFFAAANLLQIIRVKPNYHRFRYMNHSYSLHSHTQPISAKYANTEAGMKDPGQILPLTTLTYHILLALADNDRHGYSIIKEVEERTGQSMRIETGALYHAIRRMRDEGLIEPIPATERQTGEDSRRRTYRLTTWGREVLAAESSRLRQLVDIAEAKQVLKARAT